MVRGSKKEDNEFTVFTGHTKVFHSGAMSSPVALPAAPGMIDLLPNTSPTAYAQAPAA